MLGEPKAWTQARNQRAQMMYPELAMASPEELIQIDTWGVAQGRPVSTFTQQVMRTALYGAQLRKSSE